MDKVSREVRSRIMRAIKGKDTAPELTVRRTVHAMGFRYRLHGRRLPGTPDLVFARLRTCLFVHGCFWHRHAGCGAASEPKSNTEFWTAKFRRNVERDARSAAQLRSLGWRVETIWECETKDPGELRLRLEDILRGAPDP